MRRVKDEADRLELRTKRIRTVKGTERGGTAFSRGHLYRHRQLVTLGPLNLGDRQRIENLSPTHTADFGPYLEFSGPGWGEGPQVGFSNINAKAEGIENRPAFREAYPQRSSWGDDNRSRGDRRLLPRATGKLQGPRAARFSHGGAAPAHADGQDP